MRTLSKPNDTKRSSRRKFAKTIATTLLTAPLAASFANAQTPTTGPSPQPSPTPSPAPQTPSPVADAYVEVARARFGKFVTPEQMTKIKEDLEGNVRAAERLRNHKLENSDEPDTVFGVG